MTQNEDLKINFIDLMTHDLKSSIVKIQSICSRLELENISSHHIQDIRNIHVTSCDLSRFINNILKAIQVDSGTFHINKEPTDINETIEDVIQKFDILVKKKSITIEKTLEPLFLVELDTAIIQEIFFNVIENAIKYSNIGGCIFIRTYEEDNQILVDIIDEGSGINEADCKKVFQKYYRSPQHINSTKGTGLGLYFVKYFIELHGGQVSLESYENYGTKVQMFFPIEFSPKNE